MKTASYILPDYYAGYLINGDDSGLTFDEYEAIATWIEKQMKDNNYSRFWCISCTPVGFTHTNDLNSLGADCERFIFDIGE